MTEEQSWKITCKFCDEPLREPDETLEEFIKRLEWKSHRTYGVNVLNMDSFCSLRCADDYYGYDYD